MPSPVVFTFVLALLSGRVLAQDALTLSPPFVVQSGTATLDLILSSPLGSEPSAVQFSLTYPPADVVSLTAIAGGSATAAGKSLYCSGSIGSLVCVVAGFNAGIISNGSVASVTLTTPSTVTSTAVAITNTLAANSAGIMLYLTGIGGIVSAAGPTSISLSTGHPPFFTGEVNVGSGVYYLQFQNGGLFGYYNYQDPPLVFHYDLGFESFLEANDGNGGAYFHDFASGHWFYTTSNLFPYLYDFALNTWLYYFPDSRNPGHYTASPRYFSNLRTASVFTM